MKAKRYLTAGWIGDCNEGWRGIIEPLIKELAEHDGDIFQIKEKFGGLRFYYFGGNEDFRKKVDKAEEKSYTICEYCGKPGRLRYGGWIKALCDEHAAERREERLIAEGMDEWKNQP